MNRHYDDGYSVVFPVPWGLYKSVRDTLDEALQRVVDLEHRCDMRAHHIKTPSGEIIRRRAIKGMIRARRLRPTHRVTA
jgi:hypothetical protein